MKRRSRNLLFALVVLAFAVAAPLIILYARGVVIDPDKQEIVVTGIILLDTNLARLQVHLNGEDRGLESDPVMLRGLQSGRYDVSLTREGFKPWNTTLDVVAEKVTRVEDLLMVYDKPEITELVDAKIGAFAVSPNGKYIAYVRADDPAGLWLHTVGEIEDRQLADAKELAVSKLDLIRWSDDSRLLLVHNDEGFVKIEPHVRQTTPVALKPLSDIPAIDITMDGGEPSTYYYLQNETLMRWKSSSPGALPEKLLTGVRSYVVNNPKVFVVRETTTGLDVVSLDLRQSDPEPTDVAALPRTSTSAELLAEDVTHLAAVTDERLMVLDTVEGSLEFVEVATGVTWAEWSPDGRYLAYAKGSELHAYEEEPQGDDPNDILLTRLASMPQTLSWHPDSRHLVIGSQTGAAPALVSQLSLVHVSRVAPVVQSFANVAAPLTDLALGRIGHELIVKVGTTKGHQLQLHTLLPDQPE